MASVSTYLNFNRNTEEAFKFYQSVFGGEFFGGGPMRFGDVLHIELRILGVHTLMGTDAPESMGFTVNFGNNVNINLQPDTRKETKELFTALSKDGTVTMELQDMFWGDYYGSCTDKFGVQWMFNCGEKK